MSDDTNKYRVAVFRRWIRRTPRLNWKTLAAFLLALFSASSCEFFYLHYTDCGYYDSPQINPLSLNRPVLNQQYFDQVWVSFDNDSHINSYALRFEFSGRLPPGITFYQNNRGVYFEGTATWPGAYFFTIIALVDYRIYDRYYYGHHNEYCSYRISQSYQLTVDPV